MVKIGPVALSTELVLAPLAGYSDLPFRLLCRRYGAGLCVSEMISCHGLVYRQKKTIEMLKSCSEDQPVSYQLFGADPQIMGEAASIMTSFRPDIIDINMGCPVKKVTKRGAGAALMADIDNAEAIVRSVVDNSRCPVTLKIRSGPDSTTLNAELFARMAENNGVSAIVIHGRTWKQAFSGSADWDMIRRVKAAVSIPVIGNGDITGVSDAHEKMRATNCDGIMIGRAALGNPWVFHPGGKPTSAILIASCVKEHIELIEQWNEDPARQLAAFRNHLGRYFRGFSGSSLMRRNIYGCSSWQHLKDLIYSIADGPER